MTQSYRGWVKANAEIGRLAVAASAAAAIGGLAVLPASPESHGALMAYAAVPLLVSGVLLHMIPSYSKKAAHPALPALILAALPLIALYPRLYLALHSAAMATAALYSMLPLRRTHYYQKILIVSSYLAALEAALLPLPETLAALAALHALASGIIFAVNTTALTYTYGEKPRGPLSLPLAVLHLAAPPLLLASPQLFQAAVLAELALYAGLVKMDAAGRWVSFARGLREPARSAQLNLAYSSLAAAALYPLWAIQHPGLRALHLLAFGFITLNVAAHGPVMLNLIFRLGPARPSPLPPILFAAATLVKAAYPMPGCILYIAGALLFAASLLQGRLRGRVAKKRADA